MSTYSRYRRRIGDTVNNGVAWKTPSCICSCQWCIKSQVFCSNCWMLRRVAGKARNMTEYALSIMDCWIIITHRPQCKIAKQVMSPWKFRRCCAGDLFRDSVAYSFSFATFPEIPRMWPMCGCTFTHKILKMPLFIPNGCDIWKY